MMMISGLIVIVGLYFMLMPQDANTRFGVSLRNQSKYLMFMFAYQALINAFAAVAAITFGATLFALIFVGIDIYLSHLYYTRL